ncbi:MAG TPA: ribonuclease R [Tepidisphaeraceae bacterium]|jgi:ribonuclease R|nr:ribonuclease R [Tepidisphaeraceae bacterium]
MSEQLSTQILSHLKSERYRPLKPRPLAKEMRLTEEHQYHHFRDALRELMHAGRVVLGAGGSVMLPAQNMRPEGIVGAYRQNRRGFGFVVPTDPDGHEDLFIAEGDNAGAITGDIVRAKITNREPRDGKVMFRGKIIEIITRSQKRFVGTLVRQHGKWLVLPDGNIFTAPILTPDAAARHIKPGTTVVVELTTYPQDQVAAQGVITRVLGQPGEKDVDLQSVIVQFNLPQEFPDECLDQARREVDRFNGMTRWPERVDLSGHVICTIDPDDAKDYDDAISLRRLDSGQWELGVHIADVSAFVGTDSPLDVEAKSRGNSCYFPGFVIPMLPEVLSNGVCSLQEGVPRLCKSAFIVFDDDAHPVSSHFANTVIRSANRLRYREAQAIIDHADLVPHPDGPRKIEAYDPAVVELLHQMNGLAKRIQKRRLAAGQLVLDLPEVELVLDDQGKVVGTKPEDQSFTHTLIEMFMVEANEAVARLLDSIDVPFLRRTHPEPDPDSGSRLKHFVEVAGFRLPKDLDRKALQNLLASVKGKPQSFTINLAVLKSLTRAEYSPQIIGHYALASQHYCHFTSPIRRYADLTIHRLLDQYLAAAGAGGRRGRHVKLDSAPAYDQLVDLGKHISFTERRADDAERELRQVKVLELLTKQVGQDFPGVITGITNFGVFVQLTAWLIDGLIRYEDLMDDWWEVDERGGFIRGQRTGNRIRIGDTATVRIVRVDPARRELSLAIVKLHSRSGGAEPPPPPQKTKKQHRKGKSHEVRGGGKVRRKRRR